MTGASSVPHPCGHAPARGHLQTTTHYARSTMCCSPRKWLRAFTLKEVIYTVVEAILILLLILFLVYLILHLSVCPQSERSRQKQSARLRLNGTDTRDETNLRRSNTEDGNNGTSAITLVGNKYIVGSSGEQIKDISLISSEENLNVSLEVINGTVASGDEANKSNSAELQSREFVKPVKKTGPTIVTSVQTKVSKSSESESESKESKPNKSQTTKPPSGEEEMMMKFFEDYDEDEPGTNNTLTPNVKDCKKCEEARREHERGECDCGACEHNHTGRDKPDPGTVTVTVLETKVTDDDAASDLHKSLVVALVKAEPDDTFTYLCAMAVVAEYWALGGADCIRELRADTLGNYLLVERFGEEAMGESHGVLEAARDAGGDALALRAAASLLGRGGQVARLADPLDHLLLVLGETFTALGYGKFRSIQARHEDLRLRQTCINWVSDEACEGGGDVTRRGGGGAGGALCGGVLYGAGAACYYCAGTGLWRGGVLHALAAGGGARCGAGCAPRRYTPTPPLREWLDALLRAETDPARNGTRDYQNYDY